VDAGVLTVRGAVLSQNGTRRITATHTGPASTPLAVGQELAAMLLDEGAGEILQTDAVR
jgi:hydroxymethylbilane synthase